MGAEGNTQSNTLNGVLIYKPLFIHLIGVATSFSVGKRRYRTNCPAPTLMEFSISVDPSSSCTAPPTSACITYWFAESQCFLAKVEEYQIQNTKHLLSKQ